MKRFAAVIFDMDGLLLDTERIALAAFTQTCGLFGLGDETALFMRCVGTNQVLGEQVLQQGLAGKADALAFGREWDARYLEATQHKPIPLKSGAVEFLDHVHSIHLPVAVATSTATLRATQKLRDAGILARFRAVVGGDQVEHSKPQPDIYLRAAQLLHVAPEHCLALEDSENGVRSAHAAGMTVVQIPDLIAPSPELQALGHTILPNLQQARTLLG